MTTLAEVRKLETEQKPEVMAAHRRLLEARYNLAARRDPEAQMSRGKPLCVGPTARLPDEPGNGPIESFALGGSRTGRRTCTTAGA